MRDIQIRTLRRTVEDEDKCARALDGKRDINLIDSTVLAYPATVVLVAESDNPKLYMPVQTVFMLDSLGPTPEATDRDIASALKGMVNVLAWEARKAGHGEIYMPCSHERTSQFAERHGFERYNVPMFRMRLK